MKDSRKSREGISDRGKVCAENPWSESWCKVVLGARGVGRGHKGLGRDTGHAAGQWSLVCQTRECGPSLCGFFRKGTTYLELGLGSGS